MLVKLKFFFFKKKVKLKEYKSLLQVRFQLYISKYIKIIRKKE